MLCGPSREGPRSSSSPPQVPEEVSLPRCQPHFVPAANQERNRDTVFLRGRLHPLHHQRLLPTAGLPRGEFCTQVSRAGGPRQRAKVWHRSQPWGGAEKPGGPRRQGDSPCAAPEVLKDLGCEKSPACRTLSQSVRSSSFSVSGGEGGRVSEPREQVVSAAPLAVALPAPTAVLAGLS